MNITYLFGAGASRNALPIVNEMPTRIGEFIKKIADPVFELSDKEFFFNSEPSSIKKTIQMEFIDGLKWLEDECCNHASIDTFAKKLFLKKKNEELQKLKATLSAYLTFEQILNCTAEKRYDTFFASILNTGVYELPQNVKVLSWNYDYQFEKAYSEYTDDKRMSHNQAALNVVSKYTPTTHIDKFGIYKINGTTGLYNSSYQQEYHIVDTILNEFTKKTIDSVLKNYYYSFFNNIHSTISFAWEDKREENSIVKQSIEATKNTEVLIVIGYSFPFFNREVDRKIIKSMTKLKKVYFQAPDADNIKERFLSVRDDIQYKELISRVNIDQFLLPDEL